MLNKARLLVLDVIGGTGFNEIQCESLQDFYDALKCDCFDVAYRRIGDKYFDIFVDDNGLFVDDPIPSALNGVGKPMLVGNLVFAHHDAEGNTTSLSDDDIAYIKDHAVGAMTSKRAMWTAIYPVEF